MRGCGRSADARPAARCRPTAIPTAVDRSAIGRAGAGRRCRCKTSGVRRRDVEVVRVDATAAAFGKRQIWQSDLRDPSAGNRQAVRVGDGPHGSFLCGQGGDPTRCDTLNQVREGGGPVAGDGARNLEMELHRVTGAAVAEALLGGIGAGDQMCGPGRQGEGVGVPFENREGGRQGRKNRVVRGFGDITPAELWRLAQQVRSAKPARQQLRAKANAQRGDAVRGSFSEQIGEARQIGVSVSFSADCSPPKLTRASKLPGSGNRPSSHGW